MRSVKVYDINIRYQSIPQGEDYLNFDRCNIRPHINDYGRGNELVEMGDKYEVHRCPVREFSKLNVDDDWSNGRYCRTEIRTTDYIVLSPELEEYVDVLIEKEVEGFRRSLLIKEEEYNDLNRLKENLALYIKTLNKNITSARNAAEDKSNKFCASLGFNALQSLAIIVLLFNIFS